MPKTSKTYEILCIGDPHFKETTKADNDLLVEKVLKVAQERKPHQIVVMGDLLDRHRTAHLVPLGDATDFLYKLSEIAPTFALIGNHDLINDRQYLSDYHPFSGIRQAPNLTIVSKRVVYEPPSLPHRKFLYLPYVPTGRFAEALEEVPEGTIATFCHQMFQGSSFRGVKAPEDSDYWSTDYPLAIAGHVHEYQRIGKNLVYVGTPRQSDFGDTGPSKALSLFKFTIPEDSEVTWEEERIDLGLGNYLTLQLEIPEARKWSPPTETDHYRLYITGSQVEVQMYLSSKSATKLRAKGVIVLEGLITDQPEIGEKYNPLKSESVVQYLESVYRSLEGNPRHVKWYNHLISLGTEKE